MHQNLLWGAGLNTCLSAKGNKQKHRRRLWLSRPHGSTWTGALTGTAISSQTTNLRQAEFCSKLRLAAGYAVVMMACSHASITDRIAPLRVVAGSFMTAKVMGHLKESGTSTESSKCSGTSRGGGQCTSLCRCDSLHIADRFDAEGEGALRHTADF